MTILSTAADDHLVYCPCLLQMPILSTALSTADAYLVVHAGRRVI